MNKSSILKPNIDVWFAHFNHCTSHLLSRRESTPEKHSSTTETQITLLMLPPGNLWPLGRNTTLLTISPSQVIVTQLKQAKLMFWLIADIVYQQTYEFKGITFCSRKQKLLYKNFIYYCCSNNLIFQRVSEQLRLRNKFFTLHFTSHASTYAKPKNTPAKALIPCKIFDRSAYHSLTFCGKIAWK